MTKSRTIRACAVSAVLAAALFATPASANDRTDVVSIVQLGDSYSAGNGTKNYYDGACYRSPDNYGRLTANALPADYTNSACSNAVAADITGNQTIGTRSYTRTYWIPERSYPDQRAEFLRQAEAHNVCGTPKAPATRVQMSLKTLLPAGSLVTGTVTCADQMAPQIDSVTPDTDMVFMTIGGNDGGFRDIVIQCMVLRSEKSCRAYMQRAWNTLTTFEPKMRTLLNQIDAKSHNNAYVYLLGYPDLINTNSYTIGSYDFGADLVKMQANLNEMQQRVMDEQNALTESTRFHFLPVQEAFAGHGFNPYFMGSQANSWLVPPLGNFDIPGYMHPTRQGWAAEARILTEKVQATFRR